MSGALHFDYPQVLICFALFIPLVLFDLISPRNRREKIHLPPKLRLRLSVSKFFFRTFLVCFIIALAGPRWGMEQTADEYRRGLDAVIAVDVSRSMEIEDSPSYGENAGEKKDISRIERGLTIAGEAVAAVPGARYAVALSRGRGILAIPLTWDNGTVLSFLESLETSFFTGRGTNLESLIDAAADAFQSSFPFARVILLVSDGESLSGSVKVALDRCNREGITLIALALGSEEGRPVPGLDNTISRRDSNLMRMAAERTGGIYIDGSREDAAAFLAAHLRTVAPETGTGSNRRERKARWPLFIGAAILAYALSKLCLLSIKSAAIIPVLLFPALFLSVSCSQISGKLLIMEANLHSSRGRYNEALSSYIKALEHEEAVPYAEYGLGSVFYRLDEGKAALERFAGSKKIIDTFSPEEHRELRYRINYNTGVALFDEGDFAGAASSFREALRNDPGRMDAKRNLELSLLSLDRENAPGGHSEQQGGESESRAVLFEYLRQKEQNQWKSREWAEEDQSGGPDY